MTENSNCGEQFKPLRFLTLQQVADELVTKQSTIRALIQSGELPAIQIGGRGQWRIERVKLEEYIAAAYARARADVALGDDQSLQGEAGTTSGRATLDR